MKKPNLLLLSLVGAVFLTVFPCFARAGAPPATEPSDGLRVTDAVRKYFASWFVRVDATRARQPDWITPLVTVTPLLEEEVRYDQVWQSEPHGVGLDNFGGGKGVELIPWYNVELILGYPPYLARTRPRGSNGFGDYQPLLVKYRLLSAGPEDGNYVLTLFLSATVPTGDKHNGAGHASYTPAIALGKGWGDFDFQSTLGWKLTDGGADRIGNPLLWSTAFQYRVLKKIWPEVELNYEWFADGERAGTNQLVLTTGVVCGSFPLWERLHLTFGAGYQVAVTHRPAFNNGVILSVRTPF